MNETLDQNFYAFVLGREKEIALEELKAVLRRFGFVFDIVSVSGNVALINIEKEGNCDVAKLIDILGGTIKIFKIAKSERDSECPNERMANLAVLISDIIIEHRENSNGKLNFGISDYTGKTDWRKINGLGIETKKVLKNKGFHPRFVALRDEKELSSIVSLKNNLVDKGIEIGLFDGKIGVLIALNNPEEWSKRDYGKPAGDKYSGMTPPKLARMMVNIALGVECQEPGAGLNSPNAPHQTPVVVDPFCGSGNILIEALMLGCDVIGSDVSDKAVDDSKKNIEWLLSQMSKSKCQMPNKNPNVQIQKVDATKEDFASIIDRHFEPSVREARNLRITDSVSGRFLAEPRNDFIVVTEPYLGQPKKFKPTLNAVEGEYAKVKKIYLDFFKNLSNFALSRFHALVLCVVFPLVETSDRGRFSLFSGCVDEIKKLGYTRVCPTLIYGREYQVVKREIVFLAKE